MKLVIDDKIPFIRGFAERLGETRYLPGAAITAADVKDADALIIRTRTKCNRQLLDGSKVSFIATATIGYDHIDTTYLHEAGIAWTNCPGCNASSVAQYVECVLLQLAAHGCWESDAPLLSASPQPIHREVFSGLTLGIVGVGHVGSQVEQMARRLGFAKILLCDPPRAKLENSSSYVSLEEIAHQSDVVTFHTPLTFAPAPHPTYHMASEDFFRQLRSSAVVINSSRGEVVDGEALKQALLTQSIRAAVVDTWEHEPYIDPTLLSTVFIGTPHIAGYSADGKANGTRMSLQAVARHFGFDAEQFSAVQAPSLPVDFAYYPEGDGKELAPELRLYDPLRDSQALKLHPENFETLRGNYPLRRESMP